MFRVAALWRARLPGAGVFRRRPGPALLLLAGLALCLGGCDIGYLSRAAYEEGRLLWERRPVAAELADPALSGEAREKLKTALAVRRFARDRLGLNVGGAYTTVSEVDPGATVWVLIACPKDSLRRLRAARKARAMERRGYDTLVRSTVAFSTLGYFDDPVLSNMLSLDRVELAAVLIHELFHRTFFLAGDARFDESAASYLGARGAEEFFAASQGAASADAKAARALFAADIEFARFLAQSEARLLRLYASRLAPGELMARREAAFAAIRQDYVRLESGFPGLRRFDLDRRPINNAVLAHYLVYFHGFDDFAALDRLHHDDLRATIRAVIELARANPEDPFYAVWKAGRGPVGRDGAPR
ncbi:MAG: aminopeptidase [Deltaproteobacteria bacterium]|nr:aminopeptidase [Deltaproteobacteria bacterium]